MTGSAADPPSTEFASLMSVRAYVETLRDRIGSFDATELLEAARRLDLAYREFPELLVDRTREDLLEALRSAAEKLRDAAAVPVLAFCVASDPSHTSSIISLIEKVVAVDGWSGLPPILRSLCRSREIDWPAIRSILESANRERPSDTTLWLISEVIDCLKFPDARDAADLGEILASLLFEDGQESVYGRGLVETARAARRRQDHRCFGRDRRGSSQPEALLATAERLRIAQSSALSNLGADFVWPSDRLSFDEFLLQWPCEIELAPEPEDRAFVDEAYRAILLRAPLRFEADQYLRLLRDGAMSRTWAIEDLLASEELRSLDRRLRVICEGRVITAPGSLGDAEMPAVTWPSRVAP